MAATTIGVLPLVLVVVPYFYIQFPATYDVLSLYLQGTYGRGTDPQRAMAFLTPVSSTIVGARVWLSIATIGAALGCVLAWRSVP